MWPQYYLFLLAARNPAPLPQVSVSVCGSKGGGIWNECLTTERLDTLGLTHAPHCAIYLIVSHLRLITLKCEVRKKSPCSASSHGRIQGKVYMWKFSRKCPTKYKVRFRIRGSSLH